MDKQAKPIEQSGDDGDAVQVSADGARISVKGTMSAGTFEWEFPPRTKPADKREIDGVKHHAVLHAIRAFDLRNAPSTAMLDAIAAYEQALWQPVETMPEQGCFLAQTLGGEIERVRAWREITGDRHVVWQAGTSHSTSRDPWVRWRPMPDAWRR